MSRFRGKPKPHRFFEAAGFFIGEVYFRLGLHQDRRKDRQMQYCTTLLMIWLPSSMNWAIWGERSYGVCILGLQDAITGKDDLKAIY